MLDDFLREDDDTATFLEGLEDEEELFTLPSESKYGFLGMSAGQRFVVSMLLFMVVLLSGTFCLLVTSSISLPTF